MPTTSDRLFVVMLGGTHPRAKVELHDVAFAVGDTLESVYPQLREQWFGEPRGMHVDSWMEVDGVEGWKVRLSAEPAAEGSPKLFFINLGGYEPGAFGEAHKYLLLVAADAAEAKRKGKAQAAAEWMLPHKDALYEVDDCIPVEAAGGRHLRLTQGPHAGIAYHSDYLVVP
ncbi:hypothetical protein CSC70_12660 [Pseudoxanthomonas kalamensis DSM 18571]|uniref:DUF1543 domain-containing protein n=1 Tax=Pseudoxanthomonas kalamensis TaxID=289483 RepID=UPI0013916071|nr:DUF1543 domain-containing protein [Pseudoxanthomonas kalamensis]KAF1708938.1 hypothetical protein CSC70_12660 [Pseudoxanthomonas kalamensis DSM 18571]